jgi:hypothetical protein
MSETPKQGGGVYMSAEELQKLMASAMAAAVSEARKMTPMEERKYKQELERERRRDRMAIELAKTEEQRERNRRLGCSHRCDPKTGLGVGRDRADGIWTTGGQLHGNDLATLVCLRCAWTWRWKTNSQERDYINNAGMLYMAPPDKDRVDVLLKEEETRDKLTMMGKEDFGVPLPA